MRSFLRGVVRETKQWEQSYIANTQRFFKVADNGWFDCAPALPVRLGFTVTGSRVTSRTTANNGREGRRAQALESFKGEPASWPQIIDAITMLAELASR
jgi:hypothetical protein